MLVANILLPLRIYITLGCHACKAIKVQHSAVVHTCNDGSGLQGFAEAHVIGQAAMQAGAAQECQPRNALTLIRPQLTPQIHRQLEVLNLQSRSHCLPHFRGSTSGVVTLEAKSETDRGTISANCRVSNEFVLGVGNCIKLPLPGCSEETCTGSEPVHHGC